MKASRRTIRFEDAHDDESAGYDGDGDDAVAYDPDMIRDAAPRLYAAAQNFVASHALIGGIIGLAAGGMIADGALGLILQVGCMIALACLGGYLGHEKAQEYQLRAQTALCQLRIEENTRKPAAEGQAVTARRAFPIGKPSNEDDSDDDRSNNDSEEGKTDDDPFALRAYK